MRGWLGVLGMSLLVNACTLDSGRAPAAQVPDSSGGFGGDAGFGGSAGIGGFGGDAGSGGFGGHTVDINASADGDLLRAEMTVRDVAFMQEGHLCMDVRLTNEEAVWVTELHATLGDGSHHMIVSRVEGEPATTPTECFALLGGETSRLVIAQQHDTRFTLPAEAGFLLEPHAAITIQIHYINATGGTIDVSGGIELTTRPREDDLQEARVVFTGDLSLSLPANAMSEHNYFTPLGDPAQPLRVFALTSHTHQLGVRATIRRQATESDTGELLHESLNWSEPPLSIFDQVLVFDGSDGLALRCEYNNTTNQPVGFGTGFNDEMCFMWMYAY